ncbi:MAG: hypothetical protein MUF15_23505 [Acidobacteria bacterium]|jgi:hypothetical protein|nr:hypothetical protein [Acidobacteriota bacterium]
MITNNSNKFSKIGFTGKTHLVKGVASAAGPDSREERFLSEAEFNQLSEMEQKKYLERMKARNT